LCIENKLSKRIRACHHSEAQELVRDHVHKRKHNLKDETLPVITEESDQEEEEGQATSDKPDDTLHSLTQFIIKTLMASPTSRPTLCKISGKNRRRISTVLSVLKGAGLIEDRFSDSGPLVYLDVDKFNQLTTIAKHLVRHHELKSKRLELEKVYTEQRAMIMADLPTEFPMIDENSLVLS